MRGKGRVPRARPLLVPRGTPRARRPGSEADAEVLCDTAQTRRVALPDGPELPLLAVAVELAEDHRRLGGGVLRQVVPRQLGAARLVDDADERVAHLTERLLTRLGVVDGHRED